MNNLQVKVKPRSWVKLFLPVMIAIGSLMLLNELANAANDSLNSDTNWSEVAQIIASDGAADDDFGVSAAIEGDIVIIGAPRQDVYGGNSGAAYIYKIDNATGTMTETAKLIPSDGTNSDLFGQSVAISGETIIIGAHQAYSNDQGRAYVFEMPSQGWTGTITETAILRASNRGSNDVFGFSVAVDGETVVVGAWGEDGAGPQAGALYVFEKPVGGWSGILEEDAKLISSVSPGNNGYLGQSVAIEGDVIASAVHLGSVDGADDVGRGYVFVKPQTGWSGTLTETAELLASDGVGYDKLGISVALDNGIIVMGAYQDEPSGANTNDGSLYIFEEPVGGWTGTITETAKLIASDPGSQEKLGASVDIHGDTIVAGPIAWDRTYIFTKPAGGWSGTLTETQRLDENISGDSDFGTQVAIFNDQIVVTARYDDQVAENAGRAYLFAPNQIPIADAGADQFVSASELVQLDGSASTDPEDDLPLSFYWQQAEGTGVTISDATAISPTFTAPGSAGSISFTLTVTDSLGSVSQPDGVEIVVQSNYYTIYLPLTKK